MAPPCLEFENQKARAYVQSSSGDGGPASKLGSLGLSVSLERSHWRPVCLFLCVRETVEIRNDREKERELGKKKEGGRVRQTSSARVRRNKIEGDCYI